jgi:hypothetical protein
VVAKNASVGNVCLFTKKKVPVVNINVIIERLSTSVASVFGWVTVREPRCVGTSICTSRLQYFLSV